MRLPGDFGGDRGDRGDMTCDKCHSFSATRYLDGDAWVCRACWIAPERMDTCRLFERGQENPQDPEGTTAHVRDIKDRRWHPTEKRTFYWSKEKPKSYVFLKG